MRSELGASQLSKGLRPSRSRVGAIYSELGRFPERGDGGRRLASVRLEHHPLGGAEVRDLEHASVALEERILLVAAAGYL